MNSRPPIFIIGNPRSGTTLLRLMLTCHPGICIPPECGFLLWWKSKYENMGFAQLQESLPEITSDIFSSRRFNEWNLDYQTVLATFRAGLPSTYAEIGSLVYAAYEEKQQRSDCRWGDKNNYYLDHIPEILDLYSDAQLIHLIRDGRDVACSYIELPKPEDCSGLAPRLPRTIPEIAEQWCSNVDTISRAFGCLPDNQVLTVRYEALILEPEKELRRVCSFLGEKYSSDMLNYAEMNATKTLEPVSCLQWKEKTLLPIQQDRVMRYKRMLSPEQIQCFERIASKVLLQFGYLN